MQGIDISSFQAGINLAVVPTDFVIVKATQGTNYVNHDCDRAVQQCLKLHKLFGFYHYIDGRTNAVREADYFYQNCKNYFTHGIPCVDWERYENLQWENTAYLNTFVQHLENITGIPPIIYASAAYYPYNIARQNNCGTWIAQYANMKNTGYQGSPWNENNLRCVIRQYSSKGRLYGYNGYLDLDKAYINPQQWNSYANPKHVQHAVQPVLHIQPSLDELVKNTLNGKYGVGANRAHALGTNYNRVQNRINLLYTLAKQTVRGNYGNGLTRQRRLGSNYNMVQWLINTHRV